MSFARLLLDTKAVTDWDPHEHPRDGRGRFSIVGQAVRALVETAETGEGTTAALWYGRGLDAVWPIDGSPTKVVPWKVQGRRRDVQDYDGALVREALLNPPELQLIDPRGLRATQPNITRSGVDYYFNDESYRLTGKTHEHGEKLGNRYPFIYLREDGEALILAGHHRAAAALLKGEPLEAIVISGPWGPPR